MIFLTSSSHPKSRKSCKKHKTHLRYSDRPKRIENDVNHLSKTLKVTLTELRTNSLTILITKAISIPVKILTKAKIKTN